MDLKIVALFQLASLVGSLAADLYTPGSNSAFPELVEKLRKDISLNNVQLQGYSQDMQVAAGGTQGENKVGHVKDLEITSAPEKSEPDSAPSLLHMTLKSEDNLAFKGAGCRFPDMTTNVVRSLTNQGKPIIEDRETSAIELRFRPLEISTSEDIVSAVLYIQLPTDRKDLGDILRWGLIVDYTVYEVPGLKWRRFKHISSINNLRKSKSINPVFGHNRHADDRSDLGANSEFEKLFRSMLARPIASRQVTISRHAVNASHKALELTQVVRRLLALGKFSLHRKVTNRYILVTTVKRDSAFADFHSDLRECLPTVRPQLVLVSTNRTRCIERAFEKESQQHTEARLKSSIEQSRSKTSNKATTNSKETKTTAASTDNRNLNANPSLSKQINVEKADTNQRNKRSLDQHQWPTKETVCQKRPMRVNFKQLGWSSWIIAPRSIEAYRCAGECPYPLGGALNATNHALLVAMMRSVEPESTAKPCCVATGLKPVSLLYVDGSSNIVLTKYDDMVVESCGCR